MDTKFEIPSALQHDLRYVECVDQRSTVDILQSLAQPTPVTSEKNIWAFWHEGLASMPAWCQRNVAEWVRLCQGWTIRVLDDVPGSPHNAREWVEREMLPTAFTSGTMNGPWIGQHSADFLRCPCLYLYGGVWMDVGCILIRPVDDICWNRLSDPHCSFTVAAPSLFDPWIVNSFVASRKDEPFIKHWHEIFLALWDGRSSCDGIVSHPLLEEPLKGIKFQQSPSKWEYKVPPTTVISYVGQVAAWARLCMIEEPNGGFNGRQYYATQVMLLDALPECWQELLLPELDAQKMFEILSTRLDADSTTPAYKKALDRVWSILAHSSLQFISRGKEITRFPQLGMLLDESERRNEDIESGTFLELLRYGSVHFEQQRQTIKLRQAEPPELVIRKAILSA